MLSSYVNSYLTGAGVAPDYPTSRRVELEDKLNQFAALQESLVKLLSTNPDALSLLINYAVEAEELLEIFSLKTYIDGWKAGIDRARKLDMPPTINAKNSGQALINESEKEMPSMLRVLDLAALMRVSRPTAYKLIKDAEANGWFPIWRIGSSKEIRISKEAVMNWMKDIPNDKDHDAY